MHTYKSQRLFLALRWWNELPAGVKTAESLTSITPQDAEDLRVHLDSG